MDDFGSSFDSAHDSHHSHDFHHDHGMDCHLGLGGRSYRGNGRGGPLAIVLFVVGALAMIAIVAGVTAGSSNHEFDGGYSISDAQMRELISDSIRWNADGSVEIVPGGGRSRR